MPHQDYLRRLRNETQHPSLTNRQQRGRQAEGQRRSPRRGSTSDQNQNSDAATSPTKQRRDISKRSGTKVKVKPGSVAARALAALENDGDDSDDSELSRDEGERPSRSHPPAAPDTPRGGTPSKSNTTRQPPVGGQSRNYDNTWVARLKEKLHTFAALNSPTSSVASGRSTLTNGIAARNASRSPSHSIARAQNAGRSGCPRNNVGRSMPNNNSAVARGKRVAVSQNGDRPPVKSEMSCSPSKNGHSGMAENTQKRARVNPRQCDMIDLTGDDSGEGGIVGHVGLPPIPGSGHASKKPTTISHKENSQILNSHVGGQLSNRQSQDDSINATAGHTSKKTLSSEKNNTISREENNQALNSHEDQPSKLGLGLGQKMLNNVVQKPRDKAGNDSNGKNQPMPLQRKEDNQTGNNHAADQPTDERQHQEMPSPGSKSRDTTVGVAGSKKSDATSKRKANASARKSSSTKKAPTKKSTRTPSYSLTGTLLCSVKDGNYSHIIRGLWEYENLSVSTPQRFVLRRDFPSDVEFESMPPLTTGGIFNGSFVYQWAPKGNPKTTWVIKESEVNLSFADQDGELQSFTLTGTGQNEIGKFDLVGIATKTSTRGDASREAYDIHMRKKYTEMLESRVPQPEPDGDEKKSMVSGDKRKFSMLDSSLGSDAPGDGGEKKSARREELARVITISPEESNASQQSDDIQMFDEVAGNNMEGGSSVSARIGGKKVFDVESASYVAEAATTRSRKEKHNPLTKLLSPSEDFPKNGDHKKHGSWQEFGALQGMDPSIESSTLSWNIRNVKPKYCQMTYDFFDSAGIVNVQDLFEADTANLCSRLLAFDAFKAACAFAAWRNRLKSHNDSKSFHDLFRPNCAKRSILTWEKTAETWYNKVARAESIDRTETNSSQVLEAASEMDDVASDKNQDERTGARMIEELSEMETEPSAVLVPLENILSSFEALALKKHCNITTTQQLLAADGEDLIRRLTGVFGEKFLGRPKRDIVNIVEGMLYSWMLRAQEAVPMDASTNETSSSAPQPEEDTEVRVIISRSTPAGSRLRFKTPLSYVALQFIKFQNISSDEQLAHSNHTRLAHGYVAYLGHMDKHISMARALEVTAKWRQEARLVLGISSEEDICDLLPRNTRLDNDSEQLQVMHLVPNLCKTAADEENEGLPRRTIFTYDRSNNVLYKFVVSVKQSTCSSDAGKGAFLTYKGAKVLKGISTWKIKGPRGIPLAKTRRPLEALFSTSGATVTLKGMGLHSDEHRYGPDNGDSVGLYREFTLDDFVDAEDNITFSSKHIGCALIELESRYAPLLPSDRKTDVVFSLKDFIFSNEPSSWRYDVTEELNGKPQVVDFTDDTTGAPHDVAQSHMSMYVNEVGHNMDLVENVSAKSPTPRSVAYYIHIDKPIAKDETLELLANYKEHYETMRERRGYGKANNLFGVKSDAHDITRVQRNLKDRFELEASLNNMSEDEIRDVMHFFQTRVCDGVKASTSTPTASFDSNLLRQCIALRRMDWLSIRLRRRFHELLGRGCASLLPFNGSDEEDCIFQKDMLVFVHDWPKLSPRPPYTGLATIISISKDKFKRHVFEVSLPDGKYINSVPEAVVTLPTDDDFKELPRRVYSNWMKWKKKQDLPRSRQKILKGFDSIQWDPSFIRMQLACESSSEMQIKIVRSLKWEISEELLFLLVKNYRLAHPFDEEIWCPSSVSLLRKCLHLIADYVLMGREKQILSQELLGLARDASNSMKNIISGNATATDLSFLEKSNNAQEDIRVLVAEAVHINLLTVEDYSNDPQPLDLEWYLVHQIILAVHPLASLVDWRSSSATDKPLYSIGKLCDEIGLSDPSYLSFYTSKVQEWHPLV